MRNNMFSLDGTWCNDMGITLQEPVTFEARVPKVSTVEIPGRTGDLHIYEGGFSNVKGVAKCFILKHYAYEHLSNVTKWLLLKNGYRRLEVTGEPDYFRLARVVNGPEEAIRKNILAPFEIEFDCDPRKFLKSGEMSVRLNNNGTIYNPGFPCKPLIRVSGNGTLTIGNTTIEVKQGVDEIMLDCETENAYWGLENKNNMVNAPTFPTLESGTNMIIWSGIKNVSITPRWWV